MKKLLIIVFLSELFVPLAQAQLEVRAGLNLAELADRTGESAFYKALYHVGAFYKAKLLGQLSIQPEVQYSVAGGGLELTFTGYDTKLYEFTVPVLAKLTLGTVFMDAGPQFGFLAGAN